MNALTSTTCSRKLLVLEFVTAYLHRFGWSPSSYEIAADQKISPERAKAVIRALVRDGCLVKTPGLRRSLRLPSQEERALRTLREHGWEVWDGQKGLLPPCPKTTLTVPDELFQIASRDGADDLRPGSGDAHLR